MASIDTIADRSTGSAVAGKAYFETSTNKFIIYNGSSWVELDSDGTGAVGYALDSTYEMSMDSSPVVHLDAATLTGYSEDASVSSWADRSGNSYTFDTTSALGNATDTPTYRSLGRAGRPCLQFTQNAFINNGDVFNDNIFRTANKEATLVFVANSVTEISGTKTSNSFDFYAWTSNANNTRGDRTAAPDYSNFFLSGYPGGGAVDPSYAGPGTTVSFRTFKTGAFINRIAFPDNNADKKYEFYLNHSMWAYVPNTTTGLTNKSFSTNSNGLFLGGRPSGTSPFAGEVYEVLLFDKYLDDIDWGILQNYLSNKYHYNPEVVTQTNSNTSYSFGSGYTVSRKPMAHFSADYGVYSDISGDTAASTGDSVVLWKDKVRGLPFISTNPPTLSSNVIGSEPGLTFDGVDNFIIGNYGYHDMELAYIQSMSTFDRTHPNAPALLSAVLQVVKPLADWAGDGAFSPYGHLRGNYSALGRTLGTSPFPTYPTVGNGYNIWTHITDKTTDGTSNTATRKSYIDNVQAVTPSDITNHYKKGTAQRIANGYASWLVSGLPSATAAPEASTALINGHVLEIVFLFDCTYADINTAGSYLANKYGKTWSTIS